MMNQDELKRLIRETYPFPIAHAHKKALGLMDDDLQKLKCIIVTAETAIQFLALLALAQVRQDLINKKIPFGKNLEEFIRDHLLTNPSFGKWTGLCREVMKFYFDKKEQLIVPELFDFCFSKSSRKKLSINPLQTNVISPLITLRNDFHHNRLSDNELGAKVTQGLEWLQELLNAVKFLSDYQIAFIQRITADRDENRNPNFTHDLLQINGCFSTFDQSRWQSDIHLQSGLIVLLNKQSGFLTLSPLIIFADQIPIPGIPDVFMLNRVTKNKSVYVSAQFAGELQTTHEGWLDGPDQQAAMIDFFDRFRLIETEDNNIEIDWNNQVLPEDESLITTAEAYQAKISTTEKTAQQSSPYKFLDYYGPEDLNIFFGRDQEILILQQKFYNSRLLVLHGESGTGKTSLIRAGLIPHLSPESYVPVYVRSLKEPLNEIKREMIRQIGCDDRHANLSLKEFLLKETELLSKTVVIVLDQFEEFFLRLPEDTRCNFTQELGGCMDTAHLDVKFLISIRADYFSCIAEFEETIPHIFTHQMHVPHLTEAQALEAVVKPPEQFGMSVDKAMVQDKLLPELISSHGIEPPLLQIVCDALFENARSQNKTQISMSDYEEIGDVRGVMDKYLHTKMRQFGRLQPQAREVLKSMVSAEGTNLPSFAEEILARLEGAGRGISVSDLKQTFLDKFVRDRLLRVEDIEGLPRYELCHDYLAKLVSTWISEEEYELKKAYELLKREWENWEQFSSIMSRERLLFIEAHVDRLDIGDKMKSFLAMTAFCLRHSEKDWQKRISDHEDLFNLLKIITMSENAETRLSSSYALQYCNHQSVKDTLLKLILEDDLKIIRDEAAISLFKLDETFFLDTLSEKALTKKNKHGQSALWALTTIFIEFDEYNYAWKGLRQRENILSLLWKRIKAKNLINHVEIIRRGTYGGLMWGCIAGIAAIFSIFFFDNALRSVPAEQISLLELIQIRYTSSLIIACTLIGLICGYLSAYGMSSGIIISEIFKNSPFMGKKTGRFIINFKRLLVSTLCISLPFAFIGMLLGTILILYANLTYDTAIMVNTESKGSLLLSITTGASSGAYLGLIGSFCITLILTSVSLILPEHFIQHKFYLIIASVLLCIMIIIAGYYVMDVITPLPFKDGLEKFYQGTGGLNFLIPYGVITVYGIARSLLTDTNYSD